MIELIGVVPKETDAPDRYWANLRSGNEQVSEALHLGAPVPKEAPLRIIIHA